jgi:hypothetical protein
LFEVKSADILQPGPAALTDGVRRIHEILTDFVYRGPRKEVVPAKAGTQS